MRTLSLVAMMSLTLLSWELASAAQDSGYYSTQHPRKTLTPLKASVFEPTNITVINYTQNPYYVTVNGEYDDFVDAGNSDTVKNWKGPFITPIAIKNGPYNAPFFNQTVCPRALVIVDDRMGVYHINVDSRFC